MKTFRFLVPSVLTFATVIAACGSGTADQTSPDPTSEATTVRPTQQAPSATPTSERPDAAPTDTPQAAATPATQAPPTRSAPTQPPPPPAVPTNTPAPPPVQSQSLTIAAKSLLFVPSKLPASNGSPINVTFDNQDDGIAHDLIIYTPAGGIAAQVQVMIGPSRAATAFTPSGAGNYFFKCSLHPQSMVGSIAIAP